MKHIDIIIITTEKIDEGLLSGLDYLITSQENFTNRYTISIDNEDITFDYLIIDHIIKDLGVLTEDKKIVTNEVFETSIDGIFAFKTVKSSLDMQTQLQIIINYLKNPY